MNKLTLVWLAVAFIPLALAEEPCVTIHGRAHFCSGDGQLRIWNIGTRHEFEPDDSSEDRVLDWLIAGVKESERKNYTVPASVFDLYGDFLTCPTEPLRKGAVQHAKVKGVTHRRYVRIN